MNLISSIRFTFLAGLSMFAFTSNGSASSEGSEPENFLYERPTVENFSKLYWALSRLTTDNVAHLDNFMMINECDIFKDYFNHEFEWRKIRESAVNYINTNKKDFPIRFQFVQPLRLGEYDIADKSFSVFGEYAIKPTRRFEVFAVDARDPVCGYKKPVMDYPKGLVLELSRPFALEKIYMEKEMANKYISEKLEKFKKLSITRQTKEGVFLTRDAYLLMKVKVFSSHEVPYITTYMGGDPMAQVLGVLESVEIYSDKDMQDLIHIEDFRKKRKKSPLELQYIAEYQAEKKAREQRLVEKEAAEAKEKLPSKSVETGE